MNGVSSTGLVTARARSMSRAPQPPVLGRSAAHRYCGGSEVRAILEDEFKVTFVQMRGNDLMHRLR